MIQRTAAIGALALTAFVLVLVGAIAAPAALTRSTAAPAAAPADPAAGLPAAAPGTSEDPGAGDPALLAVIQEREAAYQRSLAQAGQQLQEAAQQQATLEQANDQLRLAYQQAAEQAREQGRQVAQQQANVEAAREQARQLAQQAAALPAPAPASPATPARQMTQVEPVSPAGPAPTAELARQARPLDQQPTAVRETIPPLTREPALPVPALSAGGTPISRDQAIQAARSYLGGGTVRSAELEREHGMMAFEVEFAGGSKVYVNAATGQVASARLAAGEARSERRDDDRGGARSERRDDDRGGARSERRENEREETRGGSGGRRGGR